MLKKDGKLKEIQELIKKEVKNITYEGQLTIIEFEDGQILPLYGGVAGIEGPTQAFRVCSFCGNEASEGKPVVSLNQNDDPLICSSCVTLAMQTLIENGVEVELDLTNFVSQETIESLLKKEK